MKKYNIEEKEIFSLLTSKQIAEISEVANIEDFKEDQIIYDQKEEAKNLFILLFTLFVLFTESFLINNSFNQSG